MGILYDGKPNNLIIMQGWTYSYWAGAVTIEQSTSGHVFLLGGRLVSWQSQKQATMALLSTSEAEYMVNVVAIK